MLPWLIALVTATLSLVACLRLRANLRRARREHHAAELRLARLIQAVDSASDAIGIGDMQSDSLFHNRAHIELFGYSVADLNNAGEPAALFADKAVAREIHQSIRAGVSWHGETDIKDNTGRVFPAYVRADIIRDEHGAPVGIFGVFTDITERRAHERLIAEQHQRLEVTLQSIGDAVITTDAGARVVLMNPVAEQLTGWTQVRATGQPLAHVLSPLDEHTRAPRELPVFALLSSGGAERSSDTYLLVSPTGAERIIAENAALIRTPGGAIAGAVLALRDITGERRRADEAARSGKLESLGLLAGGIAHDFGNLLMSMVAQLTLAQRTPGLPPAAVKRLAEVEATVWRARDVTQQLVTFARGDTLRKKRLPLGPLLHEAATLAITDTAVEIHFDLPAGLPVVEADDTQLVQVFNNLAVNAVQAMPAGGTLRIRARLHRAEPGDPPSALSDGDWLRVTFADTGNGIRPEDLGKIFDPFFTTKKTGTGLGLATCYSIVRKHGGQIRVRSVVGEGTTFEVYLPAAPTDAQPNDEATAAATTTTSTEPFAPPASATPPAAPRILVLDADHASRETTTLMLTLLNNDVVEARDLRETVEKYAAALRANRRFDAVILPYTSPDSATAAAPCASTALRRLDPKVRVIALGQPSTDEPPPDSRYATILPTPVKMHTMKQALAHLSSLPTPHTQAGAVALL